MAKSVTTSSSPLQVIGRSLTRIDARAKVTGEAQFSADRIPADGLLYGKTLRSPHPHAEIVRIDTTRAVKLPGVRAIITYHDAPENPFEEGNSATPGETLAPVYVLNRIVRHVGDEVAAVAADSEAIAEENRPYGIQVLALCPGSTKTNFHEAAGMDVSLSFKGMQTANEVVETALNAVGSGRAKVVSGWTNWLVASGVNVLPNSLITRVMAKGLRGRFQKD